MYYIFLHILAVFGVNASVILVPTQYPSIQDAFDATQEGDTVLVSQGVFTEHLASPPHSFSLLSHYHQTRDSVDILNTILDGAGAGTVLTLNSSVAATAIINGFTIRNGFSNESLVAGGIHFDGAFSADVLNCVLHGHVNGWRGSAICRVMNEDTVTVAMSNIVLYDNNLRSTFEEANHSFLLFLKGSVRLRNIDYRASSWGYETGINVILSDTLTARSIHFNQANGAGMSVLADGHVEFMDVGASGAASVGIQAIAATTVADSIFLDSLHVLGSGNAGIDLRATERLEVGKLSITNSTRHSGIAPTTNEYRLLYLDYDPDEPGEHPYPVVRDLTFRNNVIGDTVRAGVANCRPAAVKANNISFEGCDFSNNTMHVFAGTNNELYSADGPLARANFSLPGDTARVRNCVFEDNLLVDHDVYTPADALANPNWGRSLHVSVPLNMPAQFIEVDHLIFRNNRQPNHVPERPGDNQSVGCDFFLDCDDSLFPDWVSVHDITMEGIDDGGMYYTSRATLNHVYNLHLTDVRRMGVRVFNLYANPEDVVSNIYIRGVREQDNFRAPDDGWAMQRALHYSSELGNTPVNCVIEGCSLAVLTSLARGLKNSIAWNNQYEYFNSPYFPFPEWQVFSYNYTDIALEGEGNIQGTDPLFDEELGAPYLSPASPCIDAGDPDEVYNDPPDTDNPELAAWPAQGLLRNDIGYFGGPRAAVTDTNWVSLPWPKTEGQVLPSGISLLPPYPNPFNPQTILPLVLSRPAHAALRVYNLQGQLVQLLVDQQLPAGRHEFRFHGGGLASGVYIVELEAGEVRECRKVLLLK